jgi:hypothetical protein
MDDSDIRNCFSTATLKVRDTTDAIVSGLIYYSEGSTGNSTMANCYFAGTIVIPEGSTGLTTQGLVYNEVSPIPLVVENCYWDKELTGILTDLYGTGLTTMQMKDTSNFTNWDFLDIWSINANINDGYPGLRNFFAYPPSITLVSVSLTKISDEIGKNTCTVVFKSNEELLEWEARAGGSGQGSGLLVGSGTIVIANTDMTFDITYGELTLGDLEYRINIYGKNSSNVWTPYG